MKNGKNARLARARYLRGSLRLKLKRNILEMTSEAVKDKPIEGNYVNPSPAA